VIIASETRGGPRVADKAKPTSHPSEGPFDDPRGGVAPEAPVHDRWRSDDQPQRSAFRLAASRSIITPRPWRSGQHAPDEQRNHRGRSPGRLYPSANIRPPPAKRPARIASRISADRRPTAPVLPHAVIGFDPYHSSSAVRRYRVVFRSILPSGLPRPLGSSSRLESAAPTASSFSKVS